MNSQRTRRLVFAGLLLASAFAVAGLKLGLGHPSPGKPVKTSRTYDWATSRSNLAAIGHALQVYRDAHVVKPVAERRSYLDAGLPSRTMEIIEPGHPWSVSGVHKVVSLANVPIQASMQTDYKLLHKFASNVQINKDGKNVWSERGERIPIYMDVNMYDEWDRHTNPRERTVLILRLDGSVDEATLVGDDWDRLIWNE